MKLDALGVPDEVRSGQLDAGSPRGTVYWTPLQYACALGDEELTREILHQQQSSSSQKNDQRGKTKYGCAPLHIAVRYGHTAIVDLLLAGSDSASEILPTDTIIGASPLHLAVVQGNLVMVQKLIHAASALTATLPATQQGTTPHELAKRLGYVAIAQLLLDYERKQKQKQILGDWLASIGMVEYAPRLVDAGFDDAAFLLANGLGDATLDAMKIEKVGHRIKLQSLYQLKEFLQEDENPEEEEEEDKEEEEEEEEEEESSSTGGGEEEDSESEEEDESNNSESGSEHD